MDRQPDTYEVALAAAEMGIVAIPCHPGSKVPCVKWKEWQTRMPPLEQLEVWFKGTRNNIAIITSGMVLFDCDDPEKAALVLEKCGETPHRLRTPRGGFHLGYRRRKGVQLGNQVKIRDLPIDIRTDGGIEVIPPSETEKGKYEWLGEGLRPVADLPFGNIGWTRERVRRRVKTSLAPVPSGGESRSHIKNPEAYCLTIDSVMGQNGSAGLVRCVCVLRDAGRSPQQTLAYMLSVWNHSPKVQPPWSEVEIQHAIDRHYGLKG